MADDSYIVPRNVQRQLAAQENPPADTVITDPKPGTKKVKYTAPGDYDPPPATEVDPDDASAPRRSRKASDKTTQQGAGKTDTTPTNTGGKAAGGA